jgi:hypothetical protein
MDLLDRGPFAVDFRPNIFPVHVLNPPGGLARFLWSRLQVLPYRLTCNLQSLSNRPNRVPLLGHPPDLCLHTNAGPSFGHLQILLWLAKVASFVASLSQILWGPPEKGWSPSMKLGGPLP